MTDERDITQGEDQILDEEARRSRLSVHLAKLVQAGAELEMQHGLRAVVVKTQRVRYLPNVVLSTIGVAGFMATSEWLFLIGGAVALLGWHQKLVSGAEQIRAVIRVDEFGAISEKVIEPA